MNKITKTFCLGSHYEGTCQEIIHEMDGFGVYTFPDRSIYQGYFKGGAFNGHGKLMLASPYKVAFFGTWSEGRLVEIDKLIFKDGIGFEMSENSETKLLTTEKWNFCCENDRRFPKEVLYGLEGIGQDTSVTARKQARDIPPGCYDTEEGIFKPTTGFITRIKPPEPSLRFVDCAPQVQWIRENCRYGGNVYENCPKSKFGVPVHPSCPTIIKNNLEAMDVFGEQLIDDPCICSVKRENIHYFDHIAKSFRSPESAGETSSPYLSSLSGDEQCSEAGSLKRNTALVACPQEEKIEPKRDVIYGSMRLRSMEKSSEKNQFNDKTHGVCKPCP